MCKKIQEQCRQDKNNYVKKICSEIEEHQNSNQTRDLYKKVRELTRKFKPKTTAIEDENGEVLWNNEDILQRWKQYCEEPYKDEVDVVNEVQVPHIINELEPNILKSEVEEAITHLKLNKTAGTDGVSAEMIKLIGEEGVKIVHNICNKVWQSRQWPKDWTNSAFIPIHKKGSTQKCQNYRTISLTSHASKILLRIID